MSDELVDTDPDLAAAIRASMHVGLDPQGIKLIRHGTNAVYLLSSAPVVVRVSPPAATATEVQRQVVVARWLASGDVPATRVLAVDQPVHLLNRFTTFWESLSDDVSAEDPNQYGSTAELGFILRRLHSLEPPPLPLPLLKPLAGARERISRAHALKGDDQRLMSELLTHLEGEYESLNFVLPQGPIHGDANVGNLLKDRSGRAVLSDLDSVSYGPREWDLVLTAMFADSYGWHTEGEYQSFAYAYGYDVTKWAGYSVLRDVREFLMVLWLAGLATNNEKAAAELQVRIQSLRHGGSRKKWNPL